jgi:uridine phosphorylase
VNDTAFPLYPGKHALSAVSDPSEHAAYVRTRHPAASLSGFDGTVLLYQQHTMDHARATYQPRRLERWVRGDLHVLERHGHTLAICGEFGLGAPAASLLLEQLIALGATRVITVGTAASLQRDLHPGDLVVCTRALRDEGVSYHYLAPARSILPSGSLTAHLRQALGVQGATVRHGTGWSTDAPYRETTAEIEQHSADGVLVADMEAAAVFAVAEHRKIDAAAVFAVADSLVDRSPRQDSPDTRHALRHALRAALDALIAAARSPRGIAADAKVGRP